MSGQILDDHDTHRVEFEEEEDSCEDAFECGLNVESKDRQCEQKTKQDENDDLTQKVQVE